MREDLLNMILSKMHHLEGRFDKVDEKLETLATHHDVMAVAQTLESITETAAASVEDKAEAGYELNKSLIFGLEKRLTETMTTHFNNVFDIMRLWIHKNDTLEKEIEDIKRRLNE